MKLLYIAFLLSVAALQPRTGDPVERTVAMLKQGSAAELGKIMIAYVDIGVLTDPTRCSKAEAENILNGFFTKNPVTGVKVIHKLDSNPELLYAVVILSTRNGSYRTSFSLKSNKGVYQLIELTIQEEKAD